MAEVFHFNECLVQNGTTSTRIDTYCSDVSVSLRKKFFEVKDEDGQVVKRLQSGQEADMSIGAAFASEISFTDGNAIRVYYGDVLGTTTYEMGSCYVTDKGWSQKENDVVTHDVKIVGRTFGTV